MKHRGLKHILTLLILLSLALLTACGGGGGDGDGSGAGTELAGSVSKGPVAGADVKIFALDATGAKGELLAEAVTDGSGTYLADLGDYEGPILVEVTGGSYLDEGSGQTLGIPGDAPLRAVHPAASGQVSLHVTPLTELAVQVAEAAGISLETVAAAYDQVSEIFGFDIETTTPLAPEAAALAGASEDEVDYALTLAVLSQLAFDRGQTIDELLADLAAELAEEGALSSATLAAFDAAAATFLGAANPDNATGLESPAGTGLAAVGRTPATLTLSVAGDLPVGRIGGLQVELVLPEEAFVAFDADGEPVVTPAEGTDPHLVAFNDLGAGTLNLAIFSLEGLGSGELATVNLGLVTGSGLGSDDFVAAEFVAIDSDGAELPDVALDLELTVE